MSTVQDGYSRIYADFAQVLIDITIKLYANIVAGSYALETR